MKLIGSVLAALVLLLVGQSSAASVLAKDREIDSSDFDYSDGALGPANWPSLFESCGGNEQSPIDIPDHSAFTNISGSNVTEIPKFKLKYDFSDDLKFAEVKLENLNYTVLLNLTGLDIKLKARGLDKLSQLVGRSAELVDSYVLEQIQFHWGVNNTEGSEHTVASEAFAAEMQLVHYNANYSNISEAAEHADGILVIAAFLEVQLDDDHEYEHDEEDHENYEGLNGDKILEPIVEAILEADFFDDGEVIVQDIDFILEDLSDELDTSKFYLYAGSLTTPTCEQAVTWIVLKYPLIISEDTMFAFRAIKQLHSNLLTAPNFRPTQDGNARVIFDAEDQTVALIGDTTAGSSTNAGKIVAGIIVPIGAVAIIGSVAVMYRRRSLAKKQESQIFDATKHEGEVANAKQASKQVSI